MFFIQMMINLVEIVTNHNPKLILLFVVKQPLAQQPSCHPLLNRTKIIKPYLWDLPWFSFVATFSLAWSRRSNDLPYLHLMILIHLSSLFTLSPNLSGVYVFTLNIHNMQYHAIGLNKLYFIYHMHNTHTFWGISML